MERSRNQIASVYAPGALFTYEGGIGCCLSLPRPAPHEPSNPVVSTQIFENLSEYVTSWYERAIKARNNPSEPPVYPEQCLDSAFMNYKMQPEVDSNRFSLTQPSHIGFIPDPLVFICSACGLLKEFDGVKQLTQAWSYTRALKTCAETDDKLHQWKQLDVVFAHWSGNYEGLSPYRWVGIPGEGPKKIKTCQECANDEYRLINISSPFFSDWKFQCTKCKSQKDVVQADRDSLEWLFPKVQNGHQPREWNMLPVSYRASQVFYVHKESFIVFTDQDISRLLTPARNGDLLNRLLVRFNFPGADLSDEDVISQLNEKQKQSEAESYRNLLEILRVVADDSHKKELRNRIAEEREKYEELGLVTREVPAPPKLTEKIARCPTWARRFNPIRLSLEHEALEKEILRYDGKDPKQPCISVNDPDICDLDEGGEGRELYQNQVDELLSVAGISRMKFIRRLRICEFSFGYSRVSANPVHNEKDRDMPVRLKAFSFVERNKHPVYFQEQENEAFYIQLDATRVQRWLEHNDLLKDGIMSSLGGDLITEYEDFGRFLDDFKERTAEHRTDRSMPSFIYMLLHSFAHHISHKLVEYSGLDQGSIGEYIFPADLAFVIYRRGMTPDLGNLSAMWRDYGIKVLESLLEVHALKCDSGSLCDQRGGACPACIMVPEVTCISGNNLLSRASLAGGLPPQWDANRNQLIGYLDPILR